MIHFTKEGIIHSTVRELLQEMSNSFLLGQTGLPSQSFLINDPLNLMWLQELHTKTLSSFKSLVWNNTLFRLSELLDKWQFLLPKLSESYSKKASNLML